MRTVVEHCARSGVQQLTLYAFSSDNWSRPVTEVNALLELFTSHFRSQADALADAGIRITVIGRRARLPLPLRSAITDAEARTAHGRAMHLRVAIDYSSRAAIETAMTTHPLARETRLGTPNGPSILPPVDLLLRTGGGPSGARVMGRFCHASPAIERIVRDHLRQEQARRPEAVFAEVVHLNEGRAGNVLCRPVLRE